MLRFFATLSALAGWYAFGAPPDFLLPDGVAPTRHTIELTIDPARGTFRGWARIAVELQKRQSEVWLNGKDLVLDRASIEFAGKTYKARTQVVGGEFIRLQSDRPLGPGPALLSIHYRAPLSEYANSGPFRNRVEGRWYAFTVFTPIDARRAFPCFDEPRFKTRWEVSMRVKRGYKAFANTPEIAEIKQSGGMKLMRFAVTPPLASEVIAFAAGPFDVWDGGEAGAKRTPVRVITPKGHANEGKAAARATADVLPKLEKYTGLVYPWEKLDHIALPAGAFGATENPGLITYRSRGLLIEPGSEAPERLRSLRAVEAHEIAHQWFGNLVTQTSWDDVWLSEAFATWLAAKIMDQEEPAAREHVTPVMARERIMAADAGPKARPVRLVMHTREEMKSVYSQIVYQKGAAVLMMLENWLGPDHFQKGIQAYLQAHTLRNATTIDFADAMAIATNRDIAPVMHTFLDQTGVPKLRGTLECNPGKSAGIIIDQMDAQAHWTVPVCWRADGVETICTLLDSRRKKVPLPVHSTCPAWVYLNASGAGYYRTDWTPEQVAAIDRVLNQLSAAERLTLVYDLTVLEKSASLKQQTDAIFRRLLSDSEPEIAHAARIALGLEVEAQPSRGR